VHQKNYTSPMRTSMLHRSRPGEMPSSRPHDLPPKRAFAALPIGVFAVVFALVGSVAVHAEVISVPSVDPPTSAASLPPPTVLRGSPPSTARPVPICPPGYTLSPGYGCIGPSSSDYTEGTPGGYDYWPYGYGYPFGGFPGFGFGAGPEHAAGGESARFGRDSDNAILAVQKGGRGRTWFATERPFVSTAADRLPDGPGSGQSAVSLSLKSSTRTDRASLTGISSSDVKRRSR
jgi:hypothetical protein